MSRSLQNKIKKKKTVCIMSLQRLKERKKKKGKKERSKPISIVNTFVTVSPSTKREEEYISHSRHARDRVFLRSQSSAISPPMKFPFILWTLLNSSRWLREENEKTMATVVPSKDNFISHESLQVEYFLARIITEIHKFSSGQIPFHFPRKRKREKGKIIIHKEITRE